MISRLVINLRSLRTTVLVSHRVRGPLASLRQYDTIGLTTQLAQKRTFIDTIIWGFAEGSDEDTYVMREDNILNLAAR